MTTTREVVTETVVKGESFGTALAIAISFTTHKSILWAMLHGFFGWFYVIYYAIVSNGVRP